MHTVSQTGNGPVAIPYTCQEASAMQNRVVDSLLAELRSVIRELGQDGRLIDPSIYDTACCPLRASSGTAIKIYLPRAHGVIDALPQPHVAEATLPRGTELVLLVEDELGVRALVARVLGNLGYPVREASEGEEAIRFIKAYSGRAIDLLL